ncbi:unnamed protein product, partial [Prorocentrum cordatum]
MAPKRKAETSAAQDRKKAKASQAVQESNAEAGRSTVNDWMDKNPSKIADLALWLMGGGFNVEAKEKVEGEMSRGTLAIADLPKKWMKDFLGKLEPALDGDLMQTIYENDPSKILALWKLAQAIPNEEPDGKPSKIAKYYPRNYIGLEHVAHLRYTAFGYRLRRFAKLIADMKTMFEECDKKQMKELVVSLCIDSVGVWAVKARLTELGDETGEIDLVHPSGLRVPCEKALGIDMNSIFTCNLFDNGATVTNSLGLNIKVVDILNRASVKLPRPDTTLFIKAGWDVVKGEDVSPSKSASSVGAGSSPQLAIGDGPRTPALLDRASDAVSTAESPGPAVSPQPVADDSQTQTQSLPNVSPPPTPPPQISRSMSLGVESTGELNLDDF